MAGEAGRDATRVDVTISYALTGALAQIGRSGLVRDLVRRIGEAFAQNLDSQLRDPAAAMPQPGSAVSRCSCKRSPTASAPCCETVGQAA